jgi:hypothetical protein
MILDCIYLIIEIVDKVYVIELRNIVFEKSEDKLILICLRLLGFD